MIGVGSMGSMGSMMSLLFAEHGIKVHFYDPQEKNIHLLLDRAKKINVQDKIFHEKDYRGLCKSLDRPKVFIFSLPHGGAGDETIDGLRPYLERGDVIMDAH